MEFKDELVVKTLLAECGIREEEIDNLVNAVSQAVTVLVDNLVPLVEAIKDIIKELNKAVNEVLEYQKELEPKYFEPYTREQVFKHITGAFIKKIYKRKEPP